MLPSKDLTGKTIEITIWNNMWYSRVVTISAGQLNNFGNRFEAGKLYYFNMSSSGAGSMVYSPTRSIGGALDGGLYFRWGGLIGWEGSTVTAVVKPSSFTQTPNWSSVNPYDATDYLGAGIANPSLKPIVDSPESGIGDPCRVYLGSGWRMPTSRETPCYLNRWAGVSAIVRLHRAGGSGIPSALMHRSYPPALQLLGTIL